MARTLCFHLDKHRDPAIAAGLRLHRVDVTTTPDACLLSTEDEEHIIDALLARGELTETTRYLPSRHWSCHRTPSSAQLPAGQIYLLRAGRGMYYQMT